MTVPEIISKATADARIVCHCILDIGMARAVGGEDQARAVEALWLKHHGDEFMAAVRANAAWEAEQA